MSLTVDLVNELDRREASKVNTSTPGVPFGVEKSDSNQEQGCKRTVPPQFRGQYLDYC